MQITSIAIQSSSIPILLYTCILLYSYIFILMPVHILLYYVHVLLLQYCPEVMTFPEASTCIGRHTKKKLDHGITIWMVYSDVECINCMCACACIRSFVPQVADFLCKLFQQTPSCRSACYRGITDAYTPILLFSHTSYTSTPILLLPCTPIFLIPYSIPY